MRTISIKQLHAETCRWVRAAKGQPIVVTDRGEHGRLELMAALKRHAREGLLATAPHFGLKGRDLIKGA